MKSNYAEHINPNPNITELRSENARLVTQANKMLNETGVLNIFAKYGKVGQVGGSYKYELMTYPDLDFGVVVENLNRQLLSEVASDLAQNESIQKLSIVDTTKDKNNNSNISGYWVGLVVPFEDDNWGLDCWLQQKGDSTKKWIDPYEERLKELSENKRDLILQIKHDLIVKGYYGSKFKSVQVYDAVLNNDINTLDEFYKLSSQ